MQELKEDTRGGAALSVKTITGKPIKFMGVGEKLDALEEFHPERIAQRMLGMGDILTLVEKAQIDFDETKAKKLQEKMANATFTLDDFLDQTSDFLVVATEGNWMLGRLAEDGDEPTELPIFTDTRHIWAFTPLCHGPVWFFRENTSENLAASATNSVFEGNASQ